MTNAIATAKAAGQPEDGGDDLRKEPIRIDPAMVSLDVIGMDLRHVVVRLPLDAIADDLNSNKDLWRRVQAGTGSGKTLRKFDKLTLIAYDETWVAECMVAEANFSTVTLTTPRIYRLPARTERLLNDGTYKISWCGNGYTIHRCNDGFMVSGPHPNIPLAEKALADLYPRPV